MATNDFNAFMARVLGTQQPRRANLNPAIMQAPEPTPTPAPQPMPPAMPTPAVAPSSIETDAAALMATLTLLAQARQPQPVQQAPTPPLTVPRRASDLGQQATRQAPQGSVMRSFQQPQKPEPAAEEEAPDYSGTYQTVTWNHNGVQYSILMPVDNTFSMPEGAQPIGDPITDPERIARAEQEGQAGQRGQAQIGLLSQMPSDVQGVFRTQSDMTAVSNARATGETQQQQVQQQQVNQAIRSQYPDMTTEQIREIDPITADLLEQAGITYVPWGTVPVMTEGGGIELVNAAEYEQSQQAQSEGPAVPDGTSAQPVAGEPGIATQQQPTGPEQPIPPLTTPQLREYDPAKAAELEANKIYEIPANQMAVRHADGTVTLVDAADTPREGVEIITYGGASEPVNAKTNPIGDIISGGGDVLSGTVATVGDIVQGDWIGALESSQHVGEGLVESAGGTWDTGKGSLLFGLEGLDFLLENVGKPAAGQGALGVANVTQALDDGWAIVQNELPEPVQQLLSVLTPPDDMTVLDFVKSSNIPGAQLAGLITPVRLMSWGSERPERVQDVYENGWDSDGDGVADHTGARAVWEAFQHDQPNDLMRGVNDIWVDPLNAFTVAGGVLPRVGARVLGTADQVPFWRWLTGGGLKTMGQALQIPDRVLDDVILGVVGRVFHFGGDAVRGIPVVRNLLDLTDSAFVDRARQGLSPIWDVLNRNPDEPLGTTPSGAAPTSPDVGPNAGGPPAPPQSPLPGPNVGPTPGGPASAAPPQPQTGPTSPNIGPTPGGPAMAPAAAQTAPVSPRVGPDEGAPTTPVTETVRGQNLRPGDTVLLDGAQAVVDENRVFRLPDGTRAPQSLAGMSNYERIVSSAQLPTGALSQPFEGTALGRPVEKPDWDFLSPVGRDETEDTPRLIDAVWDAREQYPERWQAFEAEYDPLARRFKDEQRQRQWQARSSVRDQRAEEMLQEAEHVVTELIPAVERSIGDAMNVPAYRPRFGDAADPTKAEVQVERAIFHPDPAIADQYMAALRDEVYVLNRSTGEVEFRPSRKTTRNVSPDIVRRVERLREAYRPHRNPTAQTVNEPVQARIAGQLTPQTPTTPPATTGTTEEMQPAAGYFSIDPDAVRTDPVRFQPREGVNERRVQSIADAFQRDRAEAVTVWRDPADGNLYVLSGHHRLEAAKRAKAAGNQEAAQLDARLFEGSENEARILAAGGNLNRSSQKPMELWRSYEMRREAGQSEQAAREGIDNFKKIEEASHLSPNMRRALDAGYDAAETLNPNTATISLDKAARLGRSIKAGSMTPDAAEAFYQRNPRLAEMGDRTFIGLMNKLDNLNELNRSGIAANQQQAATLFDLDTIARDDYTDLLAAIDSKGADISRLKGKLRRIDDVQQMLATTGRQTSPQLDALRQDFDAQLAALNDEITDLARTPIAPVPLSQRQPGSQVADLRARPRTVRELAADARADTGVVFGQTIVRQMPNPLAGRETEDAAARQLATFGSDAALTDEDYFRGRVLGVKERNVLGQRFTNDAGVPVDTVGDRLDRFADELQASGMEAREAEREAAKRVITDWAIEALKDRPNAYARYEKTLDRLSTRAANPVPDGAAQVRALGEVVAKNDPGALQVYDTALGILREMALYNTLTGSRYILTQAVGNTITALLTGHAEIIWDALRPQNLRAAYGALQEYPQKLIAGTDQQAYEALGIAKPDITAVVKDEVTTVGSGLRLHQTTDTLFRFGRTRLPAGKTRDGFRFSSIFANKHVRDWANSVDLSFRKSLGEHHIRGNAALAKHDFYEHTTRQLPAGITREDFDQVWDDLPDTAGEGLFSSDVVRTRFRELATTGRAHQWADQMARDWQNAVTKMKATAEDEVNRIFFSGDEYTADAIARRIVFFHYWMSRAAPLYTASLMKHAGVLNAYTNMLAEMEDTAEEYGPAAQGFVKFFQTPMGYNIFIRPDAMFQVYASFWEDAGFSPDGENLLGKFMRRAGVMFNPIVATVANLSGSMGDTFAPDPLMLGQWSRLATDGITYARSQGWISGDGGNRPAGNVYNDIMAWVRDYTTDLTEEVIPGVEHIPYRDSAVFAHRELNYLIMDVAEERGYDRDGIEAMTALNNPDSPLYQEAFRRMATQGMLDNALRYVPLFGTPILYPKSRVASQDEMNVQIYALPEGSEERNALMDQRTMANTVDPNASALRLATDQYYGIGTEAQREAYATYNGIRYGDLAAPVEIAGQTVTPAQLRGTSDEVRRQLADLWATEQGVTDDIAFVREARGDFRESNAAYGDYDTWADMVRDHPGGPVRWWRETAAANPNAARWFADYQQSYTGPVKDFANGLTGQRAFMAAVGFQPTYSDPSPISTRDQGAVPYMAGAGQPGSIQPGYPERESGPTVESITSSLERYEVERQQYNQIVSSMYGQPVDIDQLNPMARDATTANIQSAYGISPPSVSGTAQHYLQWASQQAGGDTSIAAYLEWRNQQVGTYGQTSGSMRSDVTQLPALPASSAP